MNYRSSNEGVGESEDPSRRLLELWQGSGDREALEELMRLETGLLKHRIVHQGWHGLDPTASVSDAAQEAVLRLLQVDPAPRFDDPRSLRAYLWRSAWHFFVDRVRQRGGPEAVRLDAGDGGPRDAALETTGGFSGLERREEQLSVRPCVALLTPGEREILDLVCFQRLDVIGAGQRLGIGREAAKSRLARARRKLARKLRSWVELIG